MVRGQAIRDGLSFESECQSANFIEAWQVDRQVGKWLVYNIFMHFWVGSHLERFQFSECFLVIFFALNLCSIHTRGRTLMTILVGEWLQATPTKFLIYNWDSRPITFLVGLSNLSNTVGYPLVN